MTRRALPALALLLAACSSAPQYEIPAGPPTTTAPTGDALFEHLLSYEQVAHAGRLDAMIPAAKELCRTISSVDGAAAWEKRESTLTVLIATGNFDGKSEAHGFLAAAVGAYCPEHTDLLGR